MSYFPTAYLRHWSKEALDIGGQVHVTRSSDGKITGLFTYDGYEQTGTIFTKSPGVFNHFFHLRNVLSVFSELEVGKSAGSFDILTRDINHLEVERKFKHEVTIENKLREIERFMSLTIQGLNPKWVRVAHRNGDRCFAVRIGDEIAGIAWLSLVDGIGRVTSLYVKPQYRKTGIASDLFYARLLYLKSKNAKSYFAEIAHDNEPALKHALKVGMSVAGKVFEYRPTSE